MTVVEDQAHDTKYLRKLQITLTQFYFIWICRKEETKNDCSQYLCITILISKLTICFKIKTGSFKSYFQLNLQGTDMFGDFCISCNCDIIQFLDR